MAKTVSSLKPTEDDGREAEQLLGEAEWSRLAPEARADLAAAYAGGKVLLHTLETPFRKAREIAKQAAIERGLDAKHAERVGRILGIADWISAYAINFPVVTWATGNPLLGKASSWLPVASMAYIAYSGVRNRIATIRAAGKILSGQTNTQEGRQQSSRLAGELLERIAKCGDGYEALVVAALDVTHDLRKAIQRADALWPKFRGNLG